MLKRTLKYLVVTLLEWEARLILRKYKPKIIAVTGSVGKTSTKEAIAAALGAGSGTVRRSAKSYNSELGVPLTIIDASTAWSSVLGWLAVLWRGLKLIVFDHLYPDWLVLEIGADRPGDIKRLVKWVRPQIAVITRLPEIPVHIEFFSSRQAVVAEKMSLALAVGQDGAVFLNNDDPTMTDYREKIHARVYTYGATASADYRFSNAHVYYETQPGRSLPIGTAFKFEYAENSLPVRMQGIAAPHLCFPFTAALAVALTQGVNVVSALDALVALSPAAGRCRILRGIKETTIIDDSYNASPAALEAGLATLGGIETEGRRIAVLGDMLELGGYTVEAHRLAGVQAAQACDLLLTVGLRAKFINESAISAGLAAKKSFHFDDAVSAGKKLQELLKVGDVIYVKGSQSMRMEKVVEEVMRDPAEKEKLLVRQEKEWAKSR